MITKDELAAMIVALESQPHLSLKEEKYLTIMKELEVLRDSPLMPEEPHPAALYAIWAHRHDLRGDSENKICRVSYKRLRQYLIGTAQPQAEWERPSKHGFKE